MEIKQSMFPHLPQRLSRWGFLAGDYVKEYIARFYTSALEEA
jgi:hypothetical protein